jgi:hypothetical protein
LNPACFTAPKLELGLESASTIYGPGVIDFDMAVQKEFAVKSASAFSPNRRLQRVQSTNFLYKATELQLLPQTNGIVTVSYLTTRLWAAIPAAS